MNEHKIIEKQLFKNMCFNLFAFTMIFAIFGGIIFNQIKITLYNNVDDELIKTKQRIENGQIRELDYNQIKNALQVRADVELEIKDITQLINPKVIYILRSQNGEIVNENSIGRFFEEFIDYVEFNKTELNKIFNTKIDGYDYRETNFSIVDENGQTWYVQLLINTDTEEHIIKNFFEMLWLGITVTVVLAIIASYILSKKTLKPIMESWKKQTEFVQNASHELRTPLTIMQARQELLLLEPNSTILEKSEDIVLTLNETKRLSKLTTDLMTLARADSSNYQVIKEETDIDELIHMVLKPYVEYAKTQKKEIHIDLKYGKKIMVDKNKIQQLIVILCDNAIKYTEEKDNIYILTYLKDGKCVIEVKDTGIGISNEAMKHIFERFYREDKSRTRRSGGTGLGLSIAKWIVNIHGGNIKVAHNTPKGTIFTVRLK